MKQHYDVSLRWMTVTCFEFRLGSIRLISDPCITGTPCTAVTREDFGSCDIVTLSHGHWDHISDMEYVVNRDHPLVLCGDCTAEPMARWLNYTPTRIYPMYPGTELNFGDVTIQALYGRHCNLGSGFNDQCKLLATRPWTVNHPESMEVQAWGSMEYRNYLYTLKNGTKILLWGNDPTIEQKNMLTPICPDIAILQLSKQDPLEMAEFAAAIGCKVLIPHHMDLKMTKEQYMVKVNALQEEFLKRVPDGTFICPENGQWIHL